MKKTTKLLNLQLQNFKGIASGIFSFNGENTEIIADIMQGKSTIKEAYLWCLGIEIDNFYPVDKNNRIIEGLETRVELTIDIDGIEYVLSRSAKVKYKNKVFDGYKKDMFEFDRVPCNTTEYKTKLCDLLGIADFDTLKYLTVLNYFNEQVNWKDRRALIYNLFVDNAAIDSLKDSPKYELISNELKKGKTSADINTMLNSENNRLNENKRRNEILLADKQSELASFAKANYEIIEEELETVVQEIKTEQARLDELDKDNIKFEISGEIICSERDIKDLKARDEKILLMLNNEVSICLREVEYLKRKGELCEKDIEENSNLYKTVKAKQFNEELTICPECGRPLEESDADKIRADWEERHEQRLQGIKDRVLELKKEYETIKEEYTDKLAELETATQEASAFNPNPKIAELLQKVQQLKDELDKCETKEIDTSYLTELKDKRNFLIVELGKKDSYDKLKAKIESLVTEQRELVNTEIVLAKKRQQLEQYTLDIIALVNDSINSHFDGVKFKLFEELTATAAKAIKETCIVTHNGIEYDSCSTGQKAISNCIIVSTLQNALEVNLPIWLDDASILNLKDEPNNQLIYLLNEKGKKLDCTRIDEVYV